MTERIYQTDGMTRCFSATVLSCIPCESGFLTELNRSAFFPGGGGQECDTGRIGGCAVLKTFERDGKLLHVTNGALVEDETVDCELDWGLRFRRMQHHMGEHVFSGVVYGKYGFQNVGFSLSEQEMTMDYDGTLTDEEWFSVQREVNAILWADRRVRCYFPDDAELAALNFRQKKALNGPIRIVSVDGVDCCACCAPHLSSTAAVGFLVIERYQPWKKGTRLWVRCGTDALALTELLQKSERANARLYSAPLGLSFEEVAKKKEELDELKNENARLSVSLFEERLKIEDFGNVGGAFLPPDAAKYMVRILNDVLPRLPERFVLFAGDDESGYRITFRSSDGNALGSAQTAFEGLAFRCGGRGEICQGTVQATKSEIISTMKK